MKSASTRQERSKSVFEVGRRVKRPRKGKERVTMRTVREGLGMTQVEMAQALDTDQAGVSRIERRQDVLLSTAMKYAAALGARLAFVFDDESRVLIAMPEADEASK